MSKSSHTVALIVLDGWGHREDAKDNAVAAAKKPFFDSLWKSCPHSLLEASGLTVGLPEGQIGNSEVGHTTIGAGVVLDTDLVRIDKAARAGEFSNIPAIVSVFDHVHKHDSTLHVIGLVSDGGVHSHEMHLHALLAAAKKAGVKCIAIHALTDGRDTGPNTGLGHIKKLEAEIARIGGDTFIASLGGRYYAMDRDNNWDRIKRAEDAMFKASGPSTELGASDYLAKVYTEGAKDELLEPVVIKGAHGHGAPLKTNDAVFIFNFRSDRVRQLSTRIKKWLEEKDVKNVHIAAMTEFGKEYGFPIAFPPISIETTLAKEVSDAGHTQAHIAETEKFPHATYFLNGGRREPHTGEKHIMLESRKDVKTHDEAPEMRAEAIADKTIEEIQAGTEFIFVNFANPDMVGHTANVPAIITAVETVDRELKRVITELDATGGQAIIIADHGNAEVNVDPVTGDKHTAHTTNVVPCILTGVTKDASGQPVQISLNNGGLSDVAPTILSLMGIKIPKKMTGKPLVVAK